MVLSHPDIRKAVKSKKIVFEPPLEESQWGEASVDLRLGRSFTTLKKIDGFKISVARGLQGLGETGKLPSCPSSMSLVIEEPSS